MADMQYHIDEFHKNSQALVEDSELIRENIKSFLYHHNKINRAVSSALNKTECNIIHLRELYYQLNYNEGDKAMSDLFKQSAQTLKITVEKMPLPYTAYKIEMPLLLPNKRKKWAAFRDTIGKSIYYAVCDFIEKNDIKPLKNSSVTFVSYFNSVHKNYIHDNDNQDTRDVLNLLNYLLILDDGGLLCDTHYMARITDKQTKTVVYITERDNFLPFLNDISARL